MRKSIVIALLLGVFQSSEAQNMPANGAINTGQMHIDMLNAVNTLRAKGIWCGKKYMPPVPPLVWNTALERAALRHANDMAEHKHFSHTGTDGSSFDKRVSAEGYKWSQVGENIAMGYKTIPEAVKGWIKSNNHCRQMMNPAFMEMGAAQNGVYWVQDFATKRDW